MKLFQKNKLIWIVPGLVVLVIISIVNGYLYWVRTAPQASNTVGTDYYVSTSSGDDNGSGTISDPYATINRCHDEINPGDRCIIREGVYRETINVTKSGLDASSSADERLQFVAYPGERVTISGLDVIDGVWESVTTSEMPWLPSNHNVYKINIGSWDFNEHEGMIYNVPGSGMLFGDGQYYPIAAEPDIGTNPMKKFEDIWAEHNETERPQSIVDNGERDTNFYENTGRGDDLIERQNYGYIDPAEFDIYDSSIELTHQVEFTSLGRNGENTIAGKPKNYWQGAYVNFVTGPRWGVFTGKILESGIDGSNDPLMDSGFLRASTGGFSENILENIGIGGYHFIWGTLNALTSEGEWHVQNEPISGDNYLYFWVPENRNPQDMVIEGKKRNFGFNFLDQDHIVVDGIDFFATTTNSKLRYLPDSSQQHGYDTEQLVTDPNESLNSSVNITVRNTVAQYPSHYLYYRDSFHYTGANAFNTGLQLHGQGHTIENCQVRYSSGNGVLINGGEGIVRGCIVHDSGYGGGSSGGVRTGGYGHTIKNNTVWNMVHTAFLLGDPGSRRMARSSVNGSSRGICTQNTQFSHNVGYDAGINGLTDLGIIYGWSARPECGGNIIDHNIFFDTETESGAFAIYLDNDAHNFLVYRNISWGTLGLNTNFESQRNQFYHNTDFARAIRREPESKIRNMKGFGVPAQDNKHYFQNNILSHEPLFSSCDEPDNRPVNLSGDICSDSPCEDYGSMVNNTCVEDRSGERFDAIGNIYERIASEFVNTSRRDFALTSNASRAIDNGEPISGNRYGFDLDQIITPTNGLPDSGALEFGQPDWRENIGAIFTQNQAREVEMTCQDTTTNSNTICSFRLDSDYIRIPDDLSIKINNNITPCTLSLNIVECPITTGSTPGRYPVSLVFTQLDYDSGGNAQSINVEELTNYSLIVN